MSETAPEAAASSDTPPGIDQSVRQATAAGRATAQAARDTGRALRSLVAADLALARSATGRALAWVGVAIVFGASSWLLAMGALIALLQRLGWSWLQSLIVATVLSLGVTVVAIWRTGAHFDNAGMHATRRQLAKLGIGDEDEDDAPADTGTDASKVGP